MAEFKLSDKVNPNKVFLLQTSELEKRLDPFYYIPELKELEEKVREKNVEPLRHFVKNVSSGATPKTAEKEKYYSNKENGIPFLRVQNLSPTGILDYENCKYINKETHEGYLKRSQVKGGDLLVKITGVGRMALASVAPDGFVGNTNQHMAVIKTGSKEISTILASYLNSDIGEKLASRRATGGTRPALDYPALLSIPILFDERILTITKKAVDEKNKKQNEAKDLLTSIDNYLLDELDIELPEKDNSLENRIFTTSLSEISGSRLDSSFHSSYNRQLLESINKSKYSLDSIKKNINFIPGYAFSSKDYLDKSDCYLITIKNISKNTVRLKNVTYLPNNYFDLYKQYRINEDDLLIAMTGATIGKVGLYNSSKKALINQRNGIIRPYKTLDTQYLLSLLNTSLYQELILKNSVGGAQPNISETDIAKIKIPLPPKEKQIEIAKHITELRNQAKQLELDTNQIMMDAKAEVENIILG
jgi:restriction endonuclease S subunit